MWCFKSVIEEILAPTCQSLRQVNSILEDTDLNAVFTKLQYNEKAIAKISKIIVTEIQTGRIDSVGVFVAKMIDHNTLKQKIFAGINTNATYDEPYTIQENDTIRSISDAKNLPIEIVREAILRRSEIVAMNSTGKNMKGIHPANLYSDPTIISKNMGGLGVRDVITLKIPCDKLNQVFLQSFKKIPYPSIELTTGYQNILEKNALWSTTKNFFTFFYPRKEHKLPDRGHDDDNICKPKN